MTGDAHDLDDDLDDDHDDEFDAAEFEAGDFDGDEHAAPAPIARFQRSAVGAVLAGGLLGLRDVLEPPKDETPAIVENWAGGEPFDDPYVVRLDPDNPADSIVMVRPHLRNRDAGD